MRALVTGAASGIGRAAARRLALDAMARSGKGALALMDRDAKGLEDAAADVRATGATTITLVGDLADAAVPAQLVAEAGTKLGGLDVLVSNAGIAQNGALAELSVEEFDRTFAINTRATWLLARAAYPLLKASRGALIVTASVSASHATPGLGAYAASKAAVLMLVRQLADEWGADGIRCNCVSPGAVHTALTDKAYGNPAFRAARAARIPLQRVGLPEDIANAIAFLAGPDAGYITGLDLAVDGGMVQSFFRHSRGDMKI
jgi:NAD(P)-dependent dehydrogenase (short-subunit alcohol dehydrogenase family)